MKFKKNIILGILVISMSVVLLNTLFANKKKNDIKDHWAEANINKFIANGYISGYDDNTFKPNKKITRAEFITVVNNLFEFSEVTDIKFDDVDSKDWFYNDVRKAVKSGYISGYSDNTFKPHNEITRQEIATIITNIEKNKDNDLDKIVAFNDANNVSDWAKPSVEGVIELSYMCGYKDNKFKPKNSATRAEAIETLSRVKGVQDEKLGTVLIEKEDYKLHKYEPREGTYLGAYILQDELISADMSTFEKMTGKKHASYFAYLGYKTGSIERTKKWMEEVKANGSIPHLAVEPNEGLDVVLKDEYLINLAKMFGELDMPIYLRFASEMNGKWVAWNGDSQEYIEKWKLVHDVMEEYAPKVMMLWTPFTTPQNSIIEYYPGDEYVDWVGINVYNVVYHNNSLDEPAMEEDPLELLDYIYDTFSARKPIQISEYGATHYTITDNEYYVDFAIEKIERIYAGIWEKYPRIKSIFYFDVNNLVNAPEGRKINNYAITDEPKITEAYKNLISNKNFLDHIKPNKEGKLNKEIFTLADELVEIDKQKCINIKNVETILGGKVTVNNNKVKYSLDDKKYTFELKGKREEKVLVSIDEFAEKVGYKIEKRGDKDTLILKKIQ